MNTALAISALPHDKGTALVCLLVFAGAALLIGAQDSTRPHRAAAGAILAVAGVGFAGIPGKSGEDGIPSIMLLGAVAVVVVALMRPGLHTRLGCAGRRSRDGPRRHLTC